jgi:amino acid adenylation domain-containing protein
MLSRIVAASARRHPNRPALVLGSNQLTYTELAAAAGRISALLAQEQGSRGGICVVAANRTPAGFSAILGILGAGMAYMPVSPSAPYDRVRIMVDATRPSAIVADRAGFEVARQMVQDASEPMTVILLEHESVPADASTFARHRVLLRSDLKKATPLAEPIGDEPDALAYILFTSGSTGRPKGVPIRRGNVVSYLESMKLLYPLKPSDRCTQLFDLTFDLSVHDLFRTLHAGASLFVPYSGAGVFAADLVERHKLTVWFSVPSVASELIRCRKLTPGALSSLRLAFFCGERLPIQVAKAMAQAAPNAKVVNLYGPTEATIAVTHYAWDGFDLPSDVQDLPIGLALPGQQAFLLGKNGQHLPAGVIGEIHLAGSQLSEGYWGNPHETAARFRQISVAGRPNVRCYKTGDLAVEHSSLGLVFRGRNDEQVKILGFRVELGEVEAVIRRAANGARVAALPWPLDENGNPTGLVAYVERGGIAVPDIYRACTSLLPEYMIPREIIEIGRLPLNANGKLDRNALLAMHRDDRKKPKTVALPTAGNIRQAVHEIIMERRRPWAPPIAQIEPDESLFDHIDSLDFVEMLLELEKRFELPLMTTIDEITNLERLVSYVLAKANPSLAPEAGAGLAGITASGTDAPKLHRGLFGVNIDYTSISEIDGINGQLAYRGMSIRQLAGRVSFVDVSHLLFHGRFPMADERDATMAQIAKGECLSPELINCIDTLVDASPILMLRSVFSFLGALIPRPASSSTAEIWEASLQTLGVAAAAIRRQAALRRKETVLVRSPNQTLSASILQAVTGRCPSALQAALIENQFVLHAEHGACASTLAARVAASTGADLHAGMTAAIGTFAGPRHGGAVQDVMDMLTEICTSRHVTEWVRDRQRDRRPVPGFGHRDYRTRDPRADLFRASAQELASAGADKSLLDLFDKLTEAMLPYRDGGVDVNVDGYTGVVFSMLDVPREYSIPLFAIARIAGWSAHIEEQLRNNILIAPRLLYRERAPAA